MLAMFEPQAPRLTDVVRGDKTFTTSMALPSDKANMVWINEAEDIAVVLKAGLQSKEWLHTACFQP